MEIYKLKSKNRNRELFPNLIDCRFKKIGEYTILHEGYEEVIFALELLDTSNRGDYIYIASTDISRVKNNSERKEHTMEKEMKIKLMGKNPPKWALGIQDSFCSYYQNEHGEQWIAKLEKEVLIFSGLDIDWEEIQLSVEQVEAENERVVKQLFAQTLVNIPSLNENIRTNSAEATAATHIMSSKYPLSRFILNSGELLWIASVLNSALPRMKWVEKREDHK